MFWFHRLKGIVFHEGPPPEFIVEIQELFLYHGFPISFELRILIVSGNGKNGGMRMSSGILGSSKATDRRCIPCLALVFAITVEDLPIANKWMVATNQEREQIRCVDVPTPWPYARIKEIFEGDACQMFDSKFRPYQLRPMERTSIRRSWLRISETLSFKLPVWSFRSCHHGGELWRPCRRQSESGFTLYDHGRPTANPS